MSHQHSKTNPVNQYYSLARLLSSPRSDDQLIAFSNNKNWTWHQLQLDVANMLRQLEHVEAERIALCTIDSYHFTVGFLAICHANKTVVLPGNYQPSALAELSANFDLLIHDEDIAPLSDQPSMTIAVNTAKSGNADTLRFCALDLDRIDVILFTSGSSGTPKAINKTLSHLDTEVAILESLWGERLKDSVIESTVSHQHIYGLLFRVLWPLCSGRAFACDNLEYPEQVMNHANVNCVLISSPALLKRLLTAPSPASIRAIFSSGGPLPYSAAQQVNLLFNQLPFEVFGSTETGGIAYRQQRCEAEYWQLFPGVIAELNPEQCLRLKSPHIDPLSWYQTADACVLHHNGLFELKGRTDRIVKIEEKRISLVEVEKRLEQLDWICESAVISMQDKQRLSLNAAVVLSESGNRKLTKLGKGKFWLLLRSELRQWIEPIAVPRRFRILDDIPVNSQGKRQVRDLELLFTDSGQ
ncbi:AMP-binding protein [Vibrio sp. E150_011]